MLAAPNALMITAGAVTLTLALEVLPVPPSVEVTWTLLFLPPAVVPVTFKEIAHEAPTASVPADRLACPAPAPAVAMPPQVLVNPLGVETTSPRGRLSVKAIPVSGMVLAPGLVTVKVSDVEPFNGMLAAPNALTIAGGVATARLAVAVFPVPPFVEVTVPVVFVY